MSATKKSKPALPQSKPKEEVNKKALIWIGAAFVVVVAVVAVLLILDI